MKQEKLYLSDYKINKILKELNLYNSREYVLDYDVIKGEYLKKIKEYITKTYNDDDEFSKDSSFDNEWGLYFSCNNRFRQHKLKDFFINYLQFAHTRNAGLEKVINRLIAIHESNF